MILGRYYSKEGIYEFKGNHYTPRRLANQLKISIPEVYTMCIDGLSTQQWPTAVLITHNYLVNGVRPVEELRKHYDGIYVQSQLHAYAIGVAGQLPDWTIPWVQSEFMLIHEYAPGKVAWMRSEDKFANDIYIFMKSCSAPEEQPEEPIEIPVITPTGKYKVSGKIGWLNVNLTIQTEE